MTLSTPGLPAPERLIGTIQENPSVDTTQKDPMIERGLEDWQYAGILAIAVGLVALVGVLSRRVEHAIMFAIVLSVILIAFFLTV